MRLSDEQLDALEERLKIQQPLALDYGAEIKAAFAELRVSRRVRKFVAVLITQVGAAVTLVKLGGDLRTANLDDRLFTDRLLDTCEAIAGAEQ